MFRFICYSMLVLIAIILSCTGQTFQYSRGWTNGKRSPSRFHTDTSPDEIFKLAENDKRLERCIGQLQRFIHNPFLIRPSLVASGADVNDNNNLFPGGNSVSANGASVHHQSNEMFEDMAPLEPAEFPAKRI